MDSSSFVFSSYNGDIFKYSNSGVQAWNTHIFSTEADWAGEGWAFETGITTNNSLIFIILTNPDDGDTYVGALWSDGTNDFMVKFDEASAPLPVPSEVMASYELKAFFKE